MKFNRNKAISLLLSICIVFGLVAVSPSQNVYGASLSELQRKEQQLQKEQAKIQSELKKAKEKKANEQKVQASIDASIKNTEYQIGVLQSRITLLNNDIEEKNAEITKAQENIDKNFDLFKKRLRATYMSGGTSTSLSLLLGAENFSDLLTRAELIKRVAEHDKNMIEGLKIEKQKIEDAKAAILANKSQVEKDKGTEVSKKKELDISYKKSTASLNSLKALEAAYAKDFDKIQKSISDLDKQITAILLAQQGGGQLSPGGWLWPVPGYNSISSYFGSRTLNGRPDNHLGIDIPTGGKIVPVVASKSGKIIIAASHWSYGNYILIDHGGGYATLYAHNSSLKVSVGQIVSQGQVIAMTGNTGNSYGIHLHFELRVNGVVRNPLSYLR